MSDFYQEVRVVDSAIYEAEERLAKFHEMVVRTNQEGVDAKGSGEFLKLMKERVSQLYALRDALMSGEPAKVPVG